MSTPLRILLVDDHAVVRMGFRLLLETTADLRVVAECSQGEEALRRYPEILPDVVVLDLSMEGMGGLETLTRLRAKHPEARVLVLSAHEDTLHPRHALGAGALGYLTKRSAAEALIDAIRQVAAGKPFLEPALAQEIALQNLGPAQSPLDALSPREFEIFVMLARGQSVNEIAETLFISPRTAGTHLYNIKQKLGAGNAAELTLIAIRHGLITA
ncbi:MAG: DNA-binding response regulator [Betaproteobacteria bacterium HGW-Betaproteobacteria-11]|nr:MAG: DNA-binding response regulator [Betaproteobacteria bacterium HGW-Betaproteobacteria-11]